MNLGLNQDKITKLKHQIVSFPLTAASVLEYNTGGIADDDNGKRLA